MVAAKETPEDDEVQRAKASTVLASFAGMAMECVASATQYGKCPCKYCQLSADTETAAAMIYAAGARAAVGESGMLNEITDFLDKLKEKYPPV